MENIVQIISVKYEKCGKRYNFNFSLNKSCVFKDKGSAPLLQLRKRQCNMQPANLVNLDIWKN